METLGNINVVKSRQLKYICEQCDYVTSRLYDYEKHLSTDKHKRVTMVTGCNPQRNHVCSCGKLFNCRQHLYRHKKTCFVEDLPLPKNQKVVKVAECFQMFPNSEEGYKCECGKTYKSRSGFWKHQKLCKYKSDSLEECTYISPPSETSQVLEILGSLKEDNHMLNEKLDKTYEDNILLKEEINQLKSGVMTAVSEPKVVNNYNNIIVLLNQKCGNAVAIDDFAKEIAMSLDDVSYALENGKVKGIENIIKKRFDELGTFSRPLHCTDVKRGTTYVKGDEGWEKDDGKINKMIKDVEFVQTKGIKMWGDANPSYSKGNSKLMDKWLQIVQCLTGSIEGVGMRKLEKRCHEMSKIDHDEWKC